MTWLQNSVCSPTSQSHSLPVVRGTLRTTASTKRYLYGTGGTALDSPHNHSIAGSKPAPAVHSYFGEIRGKSQLAGFEAGCLRLSNTLAVTLRDPNLKVTTHFLRVRLAFL